MRNLTPIRAPRHFFPRAGVSPFMKTFRFAAASLLAAGLVLLPAGLSAKQKEAPPPDASFVGEVAAQGNKFLKDRAVISKVKVRKNDAIIDPTFRADTDRLLESGLFDDVQVSLEDLPNQNDALGRPKKKVIFIVQERPVIRRVDFKGNKKLSAGKFRDTVTSKPGDPFDRFRAAQDVQTILSKYREEGYADAQVETYTSLAPKTNKVILTFFITEGGRVLIKDVVFDGNKAFSDKKLAKRMKKVRRKKPFKEDDLPEDVEAVEKFYKNHGYLKAALGDAKREMSQDRSSVVLTFPLTEGRRYRVGDVTFAGASIYSEKELRKAIVFKKGRLYTQDKMDESRQNLQDLYADKGYLRAEIEPTEKVKELPDGTGSVDFHFDIVESSIVYVDRIYVDGNTYTKEKVIRREVLLKEGDIFSAGKMRRSLEKIYNLGFLDDVQPDVQQPRSPELADVVFNVVEGKPGVLSAGAGYSSLDKLVGNLQVQHSNLFGLGHKINVTWEFGARRQSFDIGWVNPWFMDKPVSFGVNIFDVDRRLIARAPNYDATTFVEDPNYIIEDESAYTFTRRGFSLSLAPRITDRLSTYHAYTYERLRTHNIEPFFAAHPNPDFRIEDRDEIKSAVTNGVSYDTRDYYFDATRGGRHSLNVEVAGGPFKLGSPSRNVTFYKPEASTSYYIPTFWKFVFSVSGRASFIREFGNYSLPRESAERFLLGGVDTVRGYRFGNVGKAYGSSMMILNAEYKFPIVQEKRKTILQGAFFADAGGSWDRGDSSNPLRHMNWEIGSKEHQMRSSWGFGIRFKTPVFPIRLDYAFPLNRNAPNHPFESFEKFSFTIGNIF